VALTRRQNQTIARPRLVVAPAVRAAIIQLLTVAPTLAVLWIAAHWQHPLPLYGAALLQGAFATVLTAFAGLARWWRPIQLLFPIALLGAHALRLPPPLLLFVFLFMLVLFWSTFRTQVPFYPSGRAVSGALAGLLPPGQAVRLVDIGSGIGGLVLDLAQRRPAAELSGIETAPLPWLLSVLRARLTRTAARFVRGDYERLDFADYDLVFAYLSPAAMGALWRKACAEMRPATMLVSYEFNIPGATPDQIVPTASNRPPLYVWHF
jgi:SAM-dependent methyltransferase